MRKTEAQSYQVFCELREANIYLNQVKEHILTAAVFCGEKFDVDRRSLALLFGELTVRQQELCEVGDKFGKMKT